jgi:hypothetical protein
MTHAVLTGNVAIDAVDDCADSAGDPVTTGQGGVARPQDTSCDVGAFEFRPALPFSGFFQPVDNPPTVNVARAGTTIPVKFSLGGNRGLNIFATTAPVSQQFACDSSALVSGVEETVKAGASSLSDDPATDTYTYVWKTTAVWRNTCRQLILKGGRRDEYIANFQFK